MLYEWIIPMDKKIVKVIDMKTVKVKFKWRNGSIQKDLQALIKTGG